MVIWWLFAARPLGAVFSSATSTTPTRRLSVEKSTETCPLAWKEEGSGRIWKDLERFNTFPLQRPRVPSGSSVPQRSELFNFYFWDLEELYIQPSQAYNDQQCLFLRCTSMIIIYDNHPWQSSMIIYTLHIIIYILYIYYIIWQSMYCICAVFTVFFAAHPTGGSSSSSNSSGRMEICLQQGEQVETQGIGPGSDCTEGFSILTQLMSLCFLNMS